MAKGGKLTPSFLGHVLASEEAETSWILPGTLFSFSYLPVDWARTPISEHSAKERAKENQVTIISPCS